MDWTDRHCRFFHRLFTKQAVLYTEMLIPEALIHNKDRDRFLAFSPIEKPLIVQLGGSDPVKLREAVKIIEEYDYDEYNLNVGCPSDRVQSGKFGACLMQEPEVVARCVAEMTRATAKPVTVKCRIGVDDQDPETALRAFIRIVKDAGNVKHFIIHARKAWLKGLSPKDNRTVPPLNYDLVHAIKAENPNLAISLNGGLMTIEDCIPHLQKLDGVMVGRAAYQTPDILAAVDEKIYNLPSPALSVQEINQALATYAEERASAGTPFSAIARHTLGWLSGKPGARLRRRILSEECRKPGVTPALFLKAAAHMTA